MKISIFVLLVVALSCYETHAQNWFQRARGHVQRASNYARDFAGGSRDMYRAYRDMRRANTIGADKYFHARGNYDAASRGTGGRHAATIISNAREAFQGGSGRGHQDSAADQAANRWGRNGGNPNRYRPDSLNEKY